MIPWTFFQIPLDLFCSQKYYFPMFSVSIIPWTFFRQWKKEKTDAKRKKKREERLRAKFEQEGAEETYVEDPSGVPSTTQSANHQTNSGAVFTKLEKKVFRFFVSYKKLKIH